jgi:branched-chain amino acid transport system ATP-binding protein
MLEVRNVGLKFGGLAALHDVSIEVREKEIVGLIGTNGSGKSTLFNVITGIYKPNSGKVLFKNIDITGKSPETICKMGISRTFQVMKPFGSLTVLQNLMVGAYFGKRKARGTSDVRNSCLEILKLTSLFEKRNRLVRGLTFAEQKRLELARALSIQPTLLLLDEVMAGLTPTETLAYVELIKDLRQKGVTILIVEHVMKAIMLLTDRIYVLNSGQLMAQGKPEEVANDSKVIQSYLGTDHFARS